MKLTISRKILLNNLFYLIPLTVLIYIIYSSFNKDIYFASKERNGLKIQTPLLLYISNEINYQKNKSEIYELKKSLKVQLFEFKNSLRLTDEFLAQKNKMSISSSKIELALDSNNGKFNPNHFKTLLELSSYIGDTSNLILDPDLDTYYIMDATIYAIPSLIDHLMELQILIKNKTNNQNRIDVLRSLIKDMDLVRLKNDIDTAINEDTNFNDKNEFLQKNGNQLLAALTQEAEKIYENPELILKSEQLYASLASFQKGLLNSLDEMLSSRINKIENERNKNLAISCLAILIAFTISYKISNGIKRDLFSIVDILSSNSDEMNKISIHNQKLSEQLSVSSNQQSSTIYEIAAATNQIKALTEKNSEHLKNSINLTNNTIQTVFQSNELIKNLGNSINSLVSQNNDIAMVANNNSNELKSLFSIMNTIESKTKTIDDIVFQTKLLSFNASVEAARAGESGKGFAVVAEEVGNLANMSSSSARDINDVLKISSDKINQITEKANLEIKNSIENAGRSADESLQKVEKCLVTNELVVKNGDETKKTFDYLSSAFKEQENGINEINKSIHSFGGVINENVSNANELQKLSKTVLVQTESLNESIIKLKDLIGRN